jgi:hypothetical protein
MSLTWCVRSVVAFGFVVATSAAAHADCASTANSVVDRMMAIEMAEQLKTAGVTPEQQELAETMANQMKPKMKAAMTASCIKDKWSKQTLDCMNAAADMVSMQKCEDTLSAQQKLGLDDAMSDAIADGSDDATPELCRDASSSDADVIFGLRAAPASGVRKDELARRRRGASDLGEGLFTLCVTNHWSRDNASCMKSATRLRDVVACRAKLPPEAIDRFRQATTKPLTATVDCAGTMARAVGRVFVGPSESTSRERMTWALAESCSADWWSSSVVTCFAHAKTSKALVTCEEKLTSSQRTDEEAAVSNAMGMSAPASDTDAGLPRECQEYGEAVHRLAACDKMPAQARSALVDAWKQASAEWATLAPDVRANLATACKAGRDAVIESAKSVCGW